MNSARLSLGLLLAFSACGGSQTPAENSVAPPSASAIASAAPTAEPAATATPTASVSAPPPASGGTLLDTPFKPRTAIAEKTANKIPVFSVSVFATDITCANKSESFDNAHLSLTFKKWEKGATTHEFSAHAKSSNGKILNYKQAPESEGTLTEVSPDKGHLHFVAKDAGLKVDVSGEVDVLFCK